eukprot:1154560-Pelagomonas_calceolata.AAC.14
MDGLTVSVEKSFWPTRLAKHDRLPISNSLHDAVTHLAVMALVVHDRLPISNSLRDAVKHMDSDDLDEEINSVSGNVPVANKICGAWQAAHLKQSAWCSQVHDSDDSD